MYKYVYIIERKVLFLNITHNITNPFHHRQTQPTNNEDERHTEGRNKNVLNGNFKVFSLLLTLTLSLSLSYFFCINRKSFQDGNK